MSPWPTYPGVVEWSAGSRDRFIWKDGGLIAYRTEPLPAPVNYGCLPGTLNPADGVEVDAVWLGPPLPVGSRVEMAPAGLLQLADGDHKVVFAQTVPTDEVVQRLLAWFPLERGANWQPGGRAIEWLAELGVRGH